MDQDMQNGGVPQSDGNDPAAAPVVNPNMETATEAPATEENPAPAEGEEAPATETPAEEGSEEPAA